jgi:hypothetical protein
MRDAATVGRLVGQGMRAQLARRLWTNKNVQSNCQGVLASAYTLICTGYYLLVVDGGQKNDEHIR